MSDETIRFRFFRDTEILYTVRVLDYDCELIELSVRFIRDNIEAIFSAYKRVEAVRIVRLKALEPLRLNRETRWLDMSYTVHFDASVALYQSGAQIIWHPRRSIPRPGRDEIRPILLASEAIIAGTVSYWLQNWRKEQKEKIRKDAVRRARNMRAVADATLVSLGEAI